MKRNKRSEKQSINIWKQRITRRAMDHGVKTVPHLDFNAWAVFRHSQLTLLSSNIHPDRLVERGTIDQLIRSKQFSKNVLGYVTQIWIEDDYVRAATIPHTVAPSGYDVGTVEISNYRFFKREYADLLDAGVLVDQDQGIYVLLDQPFYNVDRLIEFCEVLQGLDNYCVADEGELYKVENERQTDTINNEVSSFERDLQMEYDFSNTLIRSVTLETDKELSARTSATNSYRAKLTDNQTDAAALWKRFMVDHMWDLIRKHDVEFGDDSSYIDTEKLAKLSPLYQAGSKEIAALYEVHSLLTDAKLTGLTLEQSCVFDLPDLIYSVIP